MTVDDPGAAHGDRIADLSGSAVRYGERLARLPEPALWIRLYDFGRRPVTARLRRRFPDVGAVAAFAEASCGPILHRDWRELPGTPHWRRWAAAGSSGRVAAKLYVSVAPDALPGAVGVVAGLAQASSITAFKVGADVAGLCRPDRLVVYVAAAEDLPPLGALLRSRLAGCPADGVPFSASITPDGLLSWAVDPPSGESWRQWVTARLARHLRACVREGRPGPARAALDRLGLEGVDTVRWTPVAP